MAKKERRDSMASSASDRIGSPDAKTAAFLFILPVTTTTPPEVDDLVAGWGVMRT